MYISAKVDYGMRALIELATADGPKTSDAVAGAQKIPAKFLISILTELRRAGLVASQRGVDGGYRLSRPAAEITVADVMRALDGPLAEVRGLRPEMAVYEGSARHLQEVWVAARHSLRMVLEQTTVEAVATGNLPIHVKEMVADPDSWIPRVR